MTFSDTMQITSIVVAFAASVRLFWRWYWRR